MCHHIAMDLVDNPRSFDEMTTGTPLERARHLEKLERQAFEDLIKLLPSEDAGDPSAASSSQVPAHLVQASVIDARVCRHNMRALHIGISPCKT